MGNDINIPLIVGVAAVLIIASIYLSGNMPQFIGAVTGTETITRSLPSTANKGSTFQVTWNLAGASGTYGVLIDDTLSGGCTFEDGSTHLQSFILNPETSKSLNIKAPNVDGGTCTLTGSYSLGNITTVSLPAQSISIVCAPVWTSSAWSACSAACDWTNKGICESSYTSSGTQTRTNTDTANCGVTTGQPATSQSCSNVCTRTVNQNTAADINCDNIVKKGELLAHLQRYIDGGIQKGELLNALQAWINGGGQ